MSPVIKRKGEKFTLPGKYLLFILTILCTGLIVLTLNTTFISKPLGFIAGRIISPLQEGISAVGIWLDNRAEELVQIRALLSENERLKAEIDRLTIENTLLQQDRYELTGLRELYELDAQYEEYQKIGARITGRDPGNWFYSFTIDKGADDGLAVDMNVMAGSGLVGRIVEVAPNWSRVTALIDDNFNVSGMVLSTEDILMVNGSLEMYNSGVVNFELLKDNTDQVVVGDKVVTSNISDKYLPGILIGYISTINRDSNNLTKSGQLMPAVDFEHINEVLVILQLKQDNGMAANGD